MKALDPETPEPDFEFFDWDTLIWVGVAWLVCVVLVVVIYLVDRMTQSILDILPEEKPKPE